MVVFEGVHQKERVNQEYKAKKTLALFASKTQELGGG